MIFTTPFKMGLNIWSRIGFQVKNGILYCPWTDELNDGPNGNINNNNIHNNNDTGIFEQDSLSDQLAELNQQAYTQLEYERARREEETSHRRKEQRKRDFEDAEEELRNNGRMIGELMNKKSKTCSLKTPF
ncbi:hypothetical protein KI688_002799 [Linnemannia hyalina]|uniref:Uncharacterized protein n=1 Tax=Linnemannia hyalina TaxID=64524 RepID=A0A9P8BR17_9FUNG|nr:hypothetical protein KI688_002799 [Linnemannia hyalina]